MRFGLGGGGGGGEGYHLPLKTGPTNIRCIVLPDILYIYIYVYKYSE